ncbi:GTPase-activating protein and VPS9 domain-containing protein 1 [Cimex lectularius]|uniref:Receptor-mediated endocytosis protein 6 homolog n=1 Tax=Cimex lectularius TaxID=79782 RepID=A0A8I6RSZ1_CIMLE|nr:GTPase-activating protein and VPS9 domain-containing protein 1 [Cimex lectularius]
MYEDCTKKNSFIRSVLSGQGSLSPHFKVLTASSKLARVAWTTSQQRLNLNKLALSCIDAPPATCCKKANSLECTMFVDALTTLGYQKCSSYGEMLFTLRESPELIARILIAGERCLSEEIPSFVHSLVTGLFTSCVLPKDKNSVLKILSNLVNHQFVQSENPRRMLRRSCAFSRLYSSFHENLFSAKLYLTAALYEPIMQLLMMEEKYLDIDPEKVAIRLEERMKRPGAEGCDDYKVDIENHRSSTIKSLVSITQVFILSLNENLHCFPTSICWLVNQIYSKLIKANSLSEKEAFAICTELIFARFICPAIVKPELYGITDIPISIVASFNLMQVAQIIQMLAMRKFQPVDPKLEDLYSHFDSESSCSIIDSMIDTNLSNDEPTFEEGNKFEVLSTNAALFTEAELYSLVNFLRTVSNEINCEDVKLQKEVTELISQLPTSVSNGHVKSVNSSPENSSKKTSILSKVSKGKLAGVNGGVENGSSPEDEDSGPTVLVIPFDLNNETSLGLDSEQKILALQKESKNRNKGKTEHIDRTEGQEKRTRFSLSHDDGSIGNTSDNLEVVSEVPSNHSVASSLELETEDQNDNLSDMISANVSGRGSPNISGRDTPSSQITEGDELTSVGAASRQQLEFNPLPPRKMQPQPRFDLDDKFGKFEIKTLIEGADETVSLVSDTWSTDVLASDSETVEQQPIQPAPPPILSETQSSNQLSDAIETASEAWSTDVMASDSERMTEVDTDDTASVARSDDTGRSEIESRNELDQIDEASMMPPGPAADCRSVKSDSACMPSNATGRGSSRPDNRRRTVEYVASNRDHIGLSNHEEMSQINKNIEVKVAASEAAGSPTHSVPTSEASANSPLHSSSLLPPFSSSKLQFRTSSQATSSLEVSMDDDRIDREPGAVGGCFSASSSSSGSSVGPRNPPTELSLTSTTIIVQNGSVLMTDNPMPKPAAHTGAIPKSISFDKTAERGDKELLDEDGKPKNSFFRNLKLSFKKRRGKSFRGDCYEQLPPSDTDMLPPLRLRRGMSEEQRTPRIDTSEDILAKYRGQRNDVDTEKSRPAPNPETNVNDKADKEYDVFEDAKKKLRLVLSTTEVLQLPDFLPMRQAWVRKENELVAFLQLQLAEAINLQDSCLIPQLYETLRCVKMLSEEECHKLFQSLKMDYKNRMPYISYLIKCRQCLLSTLSNLDRLLERVNREKTVILGFLSSLCVRIFLEKREEQIYKFSMEFQSLTLADEKSDLLESFLNVILDEMERDPVWQRASEDQIKQARITVERSLCSTVYNHSMYPNEEGDTARDQVLQKHITKLSKVISPDHKDLRIPQMFHSECPWLSAQTEIRKMAAYRSPRDKLHCVLRSITTIMNLLSLTCVPAADDLMPVLVYVLIMANPPSLLSTIEYVTNYYGNRLEGEEQYYWTQFCSAIEFIKTMDYTND